MDRNGDIIIRGIFVFCPNKTSDDTEIMDRIKNLVVSVVICSKLTFFPIS